ncbi:hypothetical protein KIN20_011847 [Parelaphostrongylus tenuis]|uniref:Secreted protein n=1 Tax=Parelaphostrongylus tenuis TaxID=148309 RepID=A0AAD5MU74_PARTN|nr:hypothetical protein KIN20_011847 [Parelaphostrongylus tenuis]
MRRSLGMSCIFLLPIGQCIARRQKKTKKAVTTARQLYHLPQLSFLTSKTVWRILLECFAMEQTLQTRAHASAYCMLHFHNNRDIPPTFKIECK